MKRYLVVFEGDTDGWSAYCPDLDCCVAVGATREEVEQLMVEAIPFHIEGLRQAGLEVPEPGSNTGFVTVAA